MIVCNFYLYMKSMPRDPSMISGVDIGWMNEVHKDILPHQYLCHYFKKFFLFYLCFL